MTFIELQQKSFFPAILESIAEGIVVIGMDKRIVFINRMARELIGLGDKEVEGLPCHDIMSTDLCSGVCPMTGDHNKNVCSGASYFMNINLHRKDGTSLPLCLNVAPLHDDNGEVIGMIENFRSMGEAVKVIEALEKSNVILSQEKNKIASIVNSLADGVFTVDQELRFTSFNRGMEKLTGYKEDEVLGLTCRTVLNSDNCTGSCILSYTLSNGYGLANTSERLLGKDGKMIPVFVSTAILKEEGNDVGIIATVRDASEIENLRKEVQGRWQFSNIVGKSVSIQQIFELIETMRDTDCAVLIEGESGTGKELVARAIHHESLRRDKPFVKVDCSAIVSSLFESELFGHVKGAFTGAIKDKTGKVERADGGTLFLDEIGEIPFALQSKLLRLIQDREFEKVGDAEIRKVDVRIIAATNKDLLNEIKRKNFREDLYYRLCVIPVKMPPLRERKEDIPLLVNHFLDKVSFKIPGREGVTHITPMALSALMDYDWPGNVRELENAMEHAVIRSRTNSIDYESLPQSVKMNSTAGPDSAGNEALLRGDSEEKLLIQSLLDKYHGNKSQVAKALGLSRTTFWRRLKKYGLSVS